MHRFFVPSEWTDDDRVEIHGEVAHRIGRVLRLAPGAEIVLFDGSGMEWTVRLDGVARDHAAGRVLSSEKGRGEPTVKLTLYQGVMKGSKFDWTLQKGTELGVSCFVPMDCRRSVPRIRRESQPARLARWRKIIVEAAEQSGRAVIPDVADPVTFQEVCDALERAPGLVVLPWEGESAKSLSAAVSEAPDSKEVALVIGPEGGLDPEEVDYARGKGLEPVSLGRRILRAETAGIVAVSALMYALGEMEP